MKVHSLLKRSGQLVAADEDSFTTTKHKELRDEGESNREEGRLSQWLQDAQAGIKKKISGETIPENTSIMNDTFHDICCCTAHPFSKVKHQTNGSGKSPRERDVDTVVTGESSREPPSSSDVLLSPAGNEPGTSLPWPLDVECTIDTVARFPATFVSEGRHKWLADVTGNMVDTLVLKDDVGDDGAIKLADALKKNKSITKLQLFNCDIGSKGAKALAKALEMNRTIESLNLYVNDIGDEGAKAIASALEINKSVTTLSLEYNSIGPKGATALGEMLIVNDAINALHLDSNGIGDDGAKAIAEGLKFNDALVAVYLGDNGVGATGAKALADAMEINTSITMMKLTGNSIGWKDGGETIEKCLTRNRSFWGIKPVEKNL